MNWFKIFSLVLFCLFLKSQAYSDIEGPYMQIGKFYTVKRNYGHERDVSLLHHLTDRLLGTKNYNDIWGEKPA